MGAGRPRDAAVRGPSRHHAYLRFRDGLPIGAFVRDYHILGGIMWQHLLRSTPAEEAVAVLPKLMGVVDECVRVAVSEFNRLAVEDAQRTHESRPLVVA